MPTQKQEEEDRERTLREAITLLVDDLTHLWELIVAAVMEMARLGGSYLEATLGGMHRHPPPVGMLRIGEHLFDEQDLQRFAHVLAGIQVPPLMIGEHSGLLLGDDVYQAVLRQREENVREQQEGQGEDL